MLAFTLPIRLGYDPLITLLSLLIAIASSVFALWLVCQEQLPWSRLALGSILMGLGIASMHYTGMAAMRMIPLIHYIPSLFLLSIVIAILAITLIISVLDMRLESRTSKLAVSLAEANQELTYLALHDNLTKLPNRALLEDRLRHAILRADREKRRFTLMFLDLDGFKAVNDAYGHGVGDLLLVEAAKRIGPKVRAQDTISRVGGDEFVFLGDVGEPADAAALAEKLLVIIREPFQIAGHELRMSV